ncbi:DNA-directed RNA polymerase subunit delta [Bacillus spongiae]|uniref:Probable DNA-directed RNA polymerase subunit delta n=1 Tax=Bacillus spongiae TaxID=2683610 RepID=A0ABU8HIV2_9BACI
MNLKGLSKEELKETSFIELAHDILTNKKQAIPFSELLQEFMELLDLTDAEVDDRLAQFYTDLNVDGRFLALGENKWGLRAWYPIDQIEEETVPTIKTRKKKAKVVNEEEFDDIAVEEEELDFDDLDDFEEEENLLDNDDDDDFEDDDDDFEGDAIIEGEEEDFDDEEDDE